MLTFTGRFFFPQRSCSHHFFKLHFFAWQHDWDCHVQNFVSVQSYSGALQFKFKIAPMAIRPSHCPSLKTRSLSPPLSCKALPYLVSGTLSKFKSRSPPLFFFLEPCPSPQVARLANPHGLDCQIGTSRSLLDLSEKLWILLKVFFFLYNLFLMPLVNFYFSPVYWVKQSCLFF